MADTCLNSIECCEPSPFGGFATLAESVTDLTVNLAYIDPNLFFTATTAAPHGLLTGQVIVIPTASFGAFIGTFVIVVTTPTSFNCPLSVSQGSAFGQNGVAAFAVGEPSTCGLQECCEPSPFTLIPYIVPTTVTCNLLNEFSVWFQGAPVLCSSGDEEFGLWLDGAPFVEKSDTY